VNVFVVVVPLFALGGCHYVFGTEPTQDNEPPVDGVDDATIDPSGCADGTREAFDVTQEASIAGCSGGWEIAGIAATRTPTCADTGNSSPSNPTGRGCSAADLCAEGWHVCADKEDVYAHVIAPAGCRWETADAAARMFFASAQPASFAVCGSQGTDDLFGCGSLGIEPSASSGCAPLARVSDNVCIALTVGGWECGTDFMAEAVNVTKAYATGGGALCCKDPRG
jgi:hypothetical protein